MEPSTPPRSARHRGVPATPATPRFGTFEDLPDYPNQELPYRKPQASQPAHHQQKHHQHLPTPATQRRGQHHRKRSVNALATPKQTPKRRKDPPHTLERSLLDATTEEDADAIAEEQETEADDDIDDQLEVQMDLMTQIAQGSSSKNDPLLAQARSIDSDPLDSNHAAIRHPHQSQPPPNVPGLWYVFRGKKIFRPLPPGEDRPEPVTLFKDDLQKINAKNATAGGESGSDAETDVEW